MAARKTVGRAARFIVAKVAPEEVARLADAAGVVPPAKLDRDRIDRLLQSFCDENYATVALPTPSQVIEQLGAIGDWACQLSHNLSDWVRNSVPRPIGPYEIWELTEINGRSNHKRPKTIARRGPVFSDDAATVAIRELEMRDAFNLLHRALGNVALEANRIAEQIQDDKRPIGRPPQHETYRLEYAVISGLADIMESASAKLRLTKGYEHEAFDRPGLANVTKVFFEIARSRIAGDTTLRDKAKASLAARRVADFCGLGAYSVHQICKKAIRGRKPGPNRPQK